MSFIVYGITDQAVISNAVKNGSMPTEQEIADQMRLNRTAQLSGDFTTPERAREFIEIIKRDCSKYKKLHIKQKEIYLDQETKKFKTKISIYSTDREEKL